MAVDIDVSELRTLQRDLETVDARTAPLVRAIMQKAALNIKSDLQREARGHPTFRHFPSSITYETWDRADRVEAVIGPDKDRMQGALGNILYFGTSKNGPVLPDPVGALEREAAAFDGFLSAAVGDAALP